MKSQRCLARAALLALLFSVGTSDAHARSSAPFVGSGKTDSFRSSQPYHHHLSNRLNVYQRARVRDYLAGVTAPIDTLRILGIQVQFADSLMGGQPGSLRSELRDSTFFANEMRHVEEYFRDASRDQLTLVWHVTSGLYTVSKEMGYYGEDEFEDVRGVELMQEVIALADPDEDFSLYDTFMIIHAGAGQETDIFDNSRVQIYTTFFDQPDINAAFEDSTVFGLPTNDMKDGEIFHVTNFMIVPEDGTQDGRTISQYGIWVFEVGSRLGMLPLFDSTPAIPDSRGVGDFDVMSYGLFAAEGFVPVFPSVFNRILVGWVDPLMVETDGQFRLRDINTSQPSDTVCLRIPLTESEYFLVVNRVHDANFDSLFTFQDADSNFIPTNDESFAGMEFDFFLTDFTNPFIRKPDPNYGGAVRRYVLTGSGMYIWHIDENVIRQLLAAGLLVNSYPSRKGVDLEEADGVQDMDGTADFFSFGSHFDSYRVGSNTEFGPTTKPATDTNSGAPTNVRVYDISAADSFMTCSVEIAKPYSETRTRWQAAGSHQPPTAVNIDGAGETEIVTLADNAGVFVFKADGTEFVDNVPAVIEPYIAVPGARWIGAPAFGDIDGGGDIEIVAAADSGRVYGWKGDGTEVVDGDADPATIGVLFAGAPLAAPPMLVNIDGDPQLEIAIVESLGDSLRIDFVDETGARVMPADATLQQFWPAVLRGQSCSPLAYGAVGTATLDSEGIVVATVDSTSPNYNVSVTPVRIRTGFGFYRFGFGVPIRGDAPTDFPAASAPAVGDLNGDGFDEAVITLRDGRVVLFAPQTHFYPASALGYGEASIPPTVPDLYRVLELNSPNPSAPALGDIDGNGTTEIVIADEDNFYVLENNGRLRTNWPRPKRESNLGTFPELEFERALTSPLIAEVNGAAPIEIILPDIDGTVFGYHANGNIAPGFPRPGPSDAGATPSVADLTGAELSFISLGAVGFVETVDGEFDTIQTDHTMVLSIQSLPGSSALDPSFWTAYQHDATRQGRATEFNPLKTSERTAEPNSFMVYPNPVRGGQVNARIVLNTGANVEVEVYTLEGQLAARRRFDYANPGGVIGTPFDEPIDVGRLASGVYMMRISVRGSAGSETHVKNFAILR